MPCLGWGCIASPQERNLGVCLDEVSAAGIRHHRPPDFSSHLTRNISGVAGESHEDPGKPSTISIWAVDHRNGSSLIPVLDAGQAPPSTLLCSGLRRLSNMASTSQPTAPEAVAAATPAPQARTPGSQQEYSCVLCKQRKVRCDRLNPCSSCVRAGVSCLPGVRQPYKRRRKHAQGGEPKKVQTSERSGGLYSTPSRSIDSTSSPEESRPQRQVPTFGQYDPLLLEFTGHFHGRKALLSTDASFHRSLWTGLNDEVRV